MNYPAPFHPTVAQNRAQADTREPEHPFKYSDENGIFNTLKTNHEQEETKVERRRQLRKNRISVKELRDKDQILNDETVIPSRIIDTSIRREKAPYVKFIEQSTAVLAFTDPAQPNVNYTPLQTWHTDLVRSGDWKIAHFKNIDAILLHGASYVEVVYDISKPSLTDIEYIKRENLLIPPGTENDIQSCTRLYRKYRLTKAQFKEIAKKHGFNEGEARKISDKAQQSEEFIDIYKGFMKDADGVVHVAWRGDVGICEDWLIAPRPLNLGMFTLQEVTDPVTLQPTVKAVPSTTTEYPIFVFPYHVEEDEIVLDVQGRAALDLHAQDALTSLWSSFVNGNVRASRFYPTRKTPPGETPKNVELFELKHGHVFEGDFSVFQPNYPNNSVLAAAQALQTNKAQEIGNVDYAAMNRQDTAKTATELTLAQQEADSLGGVNISLFSRCMLKVETLRWKILLSNINIDLQRGVLPQQMRVPPPPNFPSQLLFSPSLVVTMAADAQVVRRAQRQSKFQQNWPMVANSPFALPYLKDMLQDMFPDEFPRWNQEVGAADQNRQALQAALDLMGKMSYVNTPPEVRQQVVQFMNQAHAMLNPQK